MVTFHDTDRTSANNIVGPPTSIDVTRGGGFNQLNYMKWMSFI
jgi:hypothetical protein